MRCFRATVNRVRTCFPKETEVTNLRFERAVFILFLSSLNRKMLGNLFLMETRIICYLLNQARSEFMKHQHKMESRKQLIECHATSAVSRAVDLVSAATRSINLELQPSKIQVWRGSCPRPLLIMSFLRRRALMFAKKELIDGQVCCSSAIWYGLT